MLQQLKTLPASTLLATVEMLRRLKNVSVVSLLAFSWAMMTVLMFLFNFKVGLRLLPIFAIGFFVYFVYMTIKMWPRLQNKQTGKTKNHKK
jgi:hypothetical protein